jgi:hypothetical protein
MRQDTSLAASLNGKRRAIDDNRRAHLRQPSRTTNAITAAIAAMIVAI